MALQLLGIKCSPETEAEFRALLADQIPQSNGKPVSAGMFLEELIESWKNPRKIEVSKTEDVTKINLLNESIEKLHTLVTEQEATITQLQIENARLLNESGVIPPGSILFNVSDDEAGQIEELKPVLVSKGHEGTSQEALYVLIKHGRIKR
jgi:hypothetical protein